MTTRKRAWPRSCAATTAVTSLLLAPLALGVTPAGAAPRSPEPSAAQPLATAKAGHGSLRSSKLAPGLAQRRGAQAVFVQIAGPGAADSAAASVAAGQSTRKTMAVTAARRATVRRTNSAVVAKAKSEDTRAKVLFQVANAVPGVAITATPDALAAVAERSDVVKISPLVPKKATNASVAALTKALNTWKNPGVTGKGVRIGIIDTGIDYTHADFGGPGTVAAWNAAHAKPAGTFTPTAKVVGGYDFVGDDYDATPTDPGYDPTPRPDRNPLGCGSHGTHVAGTAAGYGVTSAGKTFRGSYATLTAKQLLAMRIGPGMAPQASLYALKVFGCEGSTDVVIPALDWALDPNGDGNFADHLDVVNLSLGQDYASADDPENAVVDKIAKHGVLPVVAEGNAGDLTDINGSPGNAVRSLTVASSVDQLQLRDGLKVDAPAGVAGVAAGQFSADYPWASKPDVTGSVVHLSSANADGCAPLSTADAATVKGKVAWLEWDDNDATRACGSVARSGNVASAGAIGAVFSSNRDVFGAGISGSKTIPVFQLTGAETRRLRPALTAGTLKVTFSGKLLGTIKSLTPAITDTLSTFSSRGTHGAPGVVKPDVAAVGDTVTSAGLGTGNGQLTESGTSMATPVTAGIAALVRKSHPKWTAEQVKAAIMNTAGHDVYTKPNRKGHRYGPARVGAGRIDALAAVRTKVLAFSTKHPGGVSASFGVVEVPVTKTSVTKTQTIKLQNTGSKRVTLRLSYQGVISQPGVSYRVSPAKVSVKARGTATVRVSMTATAKKLRHTLDPTMARTQTDTLLVGDVQRARQYVSDASGRVLVKQSGHPALRVPVYGAAKPVSATHMVAATVAKNKAMVVKGRGFSQGSGSTAFVSKLSAMTLGYSSRRMPTCTGSQTTGCTTGVTDEADLRYVGAGASRSASGSKADGWLWFGLSTWSNWATVGNTMIPVITIDTNRDGKDDYEVDLQNEPGTDLLTSYLYDLNAADQLIDIEWLTDGDVETNTFDTNTVLVPVLPAMIGVKDTTTSFPISYRVSTISSYGTAPTGVVDTTPDLAFDVAAPKIGVAGPLFADKAGTAIPYRLTGTTPAKALMLHLHGSTKSRRAEVLTLR